MYIELFSKPSKLRFLMAAASELHQQMVRLPIYSVLFLIYFGQSAGSGSVPISECVCPGDTLSYECTVMERGYIVWTGSAFNCSSSNYIILSGHFDIGTRTCNNGTIVARVLRDEGNKYTSQLNVTVTPDTAGKIIECVNYDERGTEYYRYTSTIPTVAEPLLPPDKIGISNADSSLRQLTFSWSPVTPDCPAIHYNILASSNCGSCPTTTNYTNATCTDILSDYSGCIFAVQTVVCGNITSNIINSIGINSTSTNVNTVCTISISLLATALMVSVVVFITVIITILRRNKPNAKAGLEQQLTNTSRSSKTHNNMESMYKDVTGPLPSVPAINTQDNAAYVHMKTTTLQESQN